MTEDEVIKGVHMFEVFCKPPANPKREAVLTDRVADFGGRLDLRENGDVDDSKVGCLTYEFHDLKLATKAASLLRQLGEHVEGPVDYGP